MKEYFVEVEGERKKHLLKVEAEFRAGERCVSFPRNEREFLTPTDPDEVDVERVFLCYKQKEKLLKASDCLVRTIEEKIIEEENGERYVI